MKDRVASQQVRTLLDGVTDVDLRALCIDALVAWRQRRGAPVQVADEVDRTTTEIFSVHSDLGRELVPLLASRKGVQVGDVNRLKEVFTDATPYYAWMSGFAEFLWWIVRAGLAVELSQSQEASPITMRLTRRGVALLESAGDDPLLPGFLDRVEARCPGVPDGVIALLVDARACLDAALLRPAVILMGVAYELAIEAVVDTLVTKGLVAANTAGQLPAERIKRIRALIAAPQVNTVLTTVDARTAAAAAYDFADALRLRRNEAAHTRPAFDFEHAPETEEFLVSAGRHLPALWSLAL